MKKILLIGCLLCANLQAQFYNFESAATGSSGISTATARQNTGWTSDGTTAQDTLVTIYRLDGKANIRFIVTDTDGDTLWFYPQNLHPFVLKDGANILMAVDSTGRAGFGTSTSGQARRAILNVLGRAANDTLAIFSNDGGGAIGDSAIVFTGNGKLLFSGGSATSGGNIVGHGSYISLNSGGVPNVDFLAGTYGAAGTRHFRFMTHSQLFASTGFFGFNRVSSTSTFTNPRALADFRTAGLADTLLIVSNDWNATLDSTFMLHANADLQSGSRAGFGVSTSGQARRAILNVLGRAANDTLVVLSNDGGGVVGDSAWTLLPNGHWNFGTSTNTAMIDLPASPTNEILWALRAAGAPRIVLGRDASSQYGTFSYDGTNTSIVNANTGGNILLNSFGGFRVSASGGQAIIAATSTKGMQGFFTVNANGTTDSLAVFRNDKNATLDSTAIILKDGSFVTGEWRIRSGADSLVFHHDGVPVFAILPDGTTADLVAGTPPTLWRNGPPQEYIWLLRLGVLLLLLLVAFKVYDYAKPRIRKHQTLPGEI